MQARLESNGGIAFSYRHAPAVTNGAVVVTPGAKSWRGSREELAVVHDEANDISPSAPADLKGMLDLRDIDVARIAATDIVEARIRLASPLDRQVLGERRLRYSIDIGEIDLNSGIDVFVTRDNVDYRAGNWTRVPIAGPAVVIEGDTLLVRLSDEMIVWRESSNQLKLTAALEERTPIDTASAAISRGHVTAAAATDFSENAEGRSGPLFQTFTRGYLNAYAVWDSVRASLAMSDDVVDAVAIYSDLFTDLYALGLAYCTVGNSGASGVMLQAQDHDPVGPDHPMRPALLLLGAAGADVPLLIHELGHRWLFNVQINGESNCRAPEFGSKKRA